MQLPDHILGKGTVAFLQQRATDTVLRIGDDRYSRPELAQLACFNFTAANNLSHIIENELKVKNTLDLFNRVPPSALCLPGLGVISLATLGAAFESKLGKTLDDYYEHHLGEGQRVVTFASSKMQHRDSHAARAERSALKRRKRARGRAAHEHRVRRFTDRQTRKVVTNHA